MVPARPTSLPKRTILYKVIENRYLSIIQAAASFSIPVKPDNIGGSMISLNNIYKILPTVLSILPEVGDPYNRTYENIIDPA